MNTKQYAASSLLVALLITNTSPWIPLAMANPVVPNSSRLGPKMDVASNGISIVNINTPNDKGLSHNQYDTFSINNNGLILNNANRPVSTELAGYIMGNPNLVGPTAKTILNEVTGTNSTAMNGALEVAGNKAHVIIANPNGISISNGTFINTNAATLTTGKPIIDNGTISAYKINQGTIDIDSKGLNTSKTARTDILAEAIKVNGELWANDLQMVSGQNTVNVNSDGKVINVTKNNESSKIGLDVAKIGGMYANSIYLVGTNDGLGVNNKGIVSARDTLSLDVNGRVQNTGTIASSDAYIKSKSFDQLGEAKFYADNATFVVDSLSQNGNQATNKNPIILAQNSLSIAGQTLSNTNGSVIKTDGKLQIGRNISYDGVISGKIDNITNIGSTIEAGTGGKITAKEINNINGGVTLKRVQVGEVETIKDEVTVNDYPGEKFTIKDPKIYHLNELTDDIDQVVVEAENLQFYAKKDHKDDWVRYNYTRTKHKDVVDISKPARIISGGDLEVSADYVKNDSSQISSAGQLTSKIGKFEQTNPSSKEYIVEDGTAVSYSRHHHNGADSTNIDTAPYHKVTELNTKLPLSVFKSNDLNSKTNIGQDSSLLNSISKISQNPNTSYIMETDPNFTNRRNFLSSDYVLNRLKLDPMNVQKRLGDGYYEQQLVMQEILRQTGKSRLQSGLTAEEQYRKLMDAGINLTKSQSIALGRELTVAEQNNLKEDVVLLVSKSVVLPNGKTETVLIPTLYLAPKTKRADGGANVQGESINLTVDKLNNSGSIIADDNTNIVGNNIHNNGGLISGNSTTLVANTDVANTSGTIVGESNVRIHANQDVINEGGHIKQNSASGQLVISADRDVINNGKKYISSDNEIVWDDSNKRKETITAIDQGIVDGQGSISINANRDVVMNAGIVQGKENIEVNAGRNIELSTQDAALNIKEDHYHKGKSGGGHSITTETHVDANFTNSVGSSIEGKSVNIKANQNIKSKGSDILAKDTVNINADSINFETAKDVATEHHSLQERKKSIAKRESIDAIDNSHIETVSGSNIGGKTVNIKATNSIEGKSITILGEDNVELQSGGEVNIGADKHILDSNSSYHHKKSGLLGGAGIGFSIGKERINSDDSKHEEITARSTIASTKGNINIRSNDTLQLTSGNIVSKNGVYLSGSNVILDGNVDNTSASHNESYKKSGLTVSLGGAAINAVTDGTRTIKQAGSRNDKRLAALELNEARKQFQDGYYAVDEALKGEKIRNPETGKVEKVDGKDKRGAKNIDNAVNLSISIGSTSQHQNQSIDVHEYNGGTIISDGSVNIEANDATKSGVNLVGQDILAKEVNINSASDINLSAGKNTLQGKDNYKHSGWSVGASLSLTSGSLLGFDASGSLAKQNGVTDQVTYKPTSIRAVELAQLKAKRDTEIIGSKVSGKGVVVNTGNNLKIESLQSVDNFKEHSKSSGFSVSTSPKFKGTIGSVGGSVGRTDSKLKSVTDQAGIFAGDNGYNISTGNTTSLKGSLISSKADKAKNSLTTRHLDINDIQNKAEYTVRDNGVQYNNFGSSKTKSKKEFDKIYKHIGLTPTGGVGAHGKSSSITKSAISDGKIIENGRMVDIKTINTDIEHSLNELQAIFDKKSIEEKQQLAHLFSVNANEAIHQIAKHEGWKDGDPRKVALHAMVGGTTANLGGGQFSDGVYAAGLSEAMMPQFKKWAGKIKGPDGKEYVDPERLQQIAFVFGYATNEISGKSGQSGAYVSYMGAKHNFGYSPDEIKEKINEVTENLSELGNRWKQDRIKGEEERIYDELHPEPLPASPDENGEALVSAEKSGNYDTEEYKEAADYTYNRDGDVDTSPTSDNYGFTLANQGVQPTGVTEDGTTYYIENGKTYMGPKVKDLDGIPSNERSNNYGLWLETNGYKPTGTSNGHTYFRFYYELNNPNQLLPYNPNYQPTDTQGYVDYIGYQVDQERPKSLLDSKISSVIENEGEQYKPFATLSMSSTSYLEKQQASKELAPVFDEAKKLVPNILHASYPDSNNHGFYLTDKLNIQPTGVNASGNTYYVIGDKTYLSYHKYSKNNNNKSYVDTYSIKKPNKTIYDADKAYRFDHEEQVVNNYRGLSNSGTAFSRIVKAGSNDSVQLANILSAYRGLYINAKKDPNAYTVEPEILEGIKKANYIMGVTYEYDASKPIYYNLEQGLKEFLTNYKFTHYGYLRKDSGVGFAQGIDLGVASVKVGSDSGQREYWGIKDKYDYANNAAQIRILNMDLGISNDIERKRGIKDNSEFAYTGNYKQLGVNYGKDIVVPLSLASFNGLGGRVEGALNLSSLGRQLINKPSYEEKEVQKIDSLVDSDSPKDQAIQMVKSIMSIKNR